MCLGGNYSIEVGGDNSLEQAGDHEGGEKWVKVRFQRLN